MYFLCDILDWLKEIGIKEDINSRNHWRNRQDVFSVFCVVKKEQFILKIISDEEEKRMFSSFDTTKDFYYPTVDNIYQKDEEVQAVLFKSSGKCLSSFMRQHKEILSPARAAKFGLELIVSQRLFQKKKWHIADSIPNSLLFQQSNELKILPLSIPEKDFKNHVFNKYAHAIAGGDVFPYPPETLYSTLDLEIDSVERGEAQDVWAIGVMLFVFLGGQKITLLKLLDYTKRSEGLQELEGFPLSPLFKRIFESSSMRRISLNELEKQLLVIENYTKSMVNDEKQQGTEIEEEHKIKEKDEQEEIAEKYKIIIENNTIEALFNKGRLYLQLKKYDEGIEILEECLSKIESMGSNKKLTINKEQVFRKLSIICTASGKTSNKLKSWISKKEEEKYKKELEKAQQKKDKSKKSENGKTSAYVEDVELILEEIQKGTVYDWEMIWNDYIQDMLPLSLPRSEKISLFLIIKVCIDQIIAEFQADTEETKPIGSILNGEVKQTYKRSLIELDYNSISRFLFSVSRQAKELGKYTLSKNLQRARTEIAKALVDAGKQEIAKEYLLEIQKTESSNIFSLQMLGEQEFSMNNLNNAMKYSQKILQSQPMNIQANLLMAKCYWSQKDSIQAKNYLNKCISVNPEQNEARLLLIDIHLTEKNLHDVLNELKLYLEKNPSQTNLYLDLGRTCSQLGMYEDSQLNYQKFLELEPSHQIAYFEFGQVLEKLKNIDEAAVKYQKSIDLNPNHLESYFELASIQENRKESQESIKTLENCTKANPESELALEKLIDILEKKYKTKKLQIAIETYGKITFEKINSSKLMVSAKNALKLGQTDNADSFFKQAMKIYPRSAELKFQIANMYFKSNINIPEALNLVIEAVEMVPQIHHYQFLLARIYISQNQLSEAYEQLLSMTESQPDHALALCELGKLQLFHKKDYHAALKTLKKSIRISDTSPGIYGALGVAYYKKGYIKFALPCLEFSLKNEEKDERIELTYGKSLYFNDQQEQAITVLQKLLGKKGSSNRPTTLFYLGLSNKELGKKAISFLSQSATVLTNPKLKIIAMKMTLNSLINERVSADIIRFIQKTITPKEKQTDPDLCAQLCEAQLICESDPLLAMHYVEQGLQADLFSQNEEDDSPKKLDPEVTFGCLIQEARILFQIGRNIDQVLINVEGLRKQIHASKEKKEKDKQLIDLQPASKNVRIKKEKSWFESDWSQEIDLLLAEIYISKNRITEGMDILQDLQKIATSPKIKQEISYLNAVVLVKTNKEKELLAHLKFSEKNDKSLYLLGCYLFQKKKYAEGRTKFVQLLKSCYYNYSYYKQYADFEFQLKCYDTCLGNYQKYIDLVTLLNGHLEKLDEKRPGLPKRQIQLDSETIANYGFCKMEKNLNKEALDLFELSISINPKSALNLEYLGKLKINALEFAEAEGVLRKSIELQEKAEAYYLLGFCRLHFKDIDDAKKCFLNAERLNNYHFLALRSLGEIYQQEKDYSLCSSYFDRCRKINVGDEITLLGLGYCLWKGENKPLEAEKCFTDCLNSNQSSEKSFQAMLVFYKETKRLPESEFILKHGKFYEKSIPILFHLGEVFFQAAADIDPKHYKSSEDFFLKLILQPIIPDSNHEFAIAYLRLSQIDYIDHRFTTSFDYLKKFIQKNADEKRRDNSYNGELSYQFQAKLLELKLRMQLGKKRISQTFFQCIKINQIAEYPYLYFSLHLLFQNSSAAWKYLDKAVSLIDEKSKSLSSELVLFLQAMRVVHTGDLEAGILLLQDCISRYESSELPNFYLGNILAKQGNFKASVINFKNSLSQKKPLINEATTLSTEQRYECICSLANAFKQQGNNTEALNQIQNCLKQDPNNSTALRMQSQIYVEEGQFVKAHQSVSSSIRCDDSVASSYYILAVASLKMGNTFSAIKSLEQCCQLNLQYPLIQLKLAAVYSSISRPQIALKHFLHHLAYNPESTQALFRGSKLLAYFGQFESSQAHIDRLFSVLNRNKLNTNDLIKQQLPESHPKKDKSLTCLEDESFYDDNLITLAEAYSVLGFLQIKQENLSAALVSYSEALKLKPNNEDIQLSIAEIYSRLNNHTEEIAIYQNLLKRNLSRKKKQKYMNNMGNAYMLLRNYREAQKAYKISAQEGEESSNVLANLGASYIALKSYDFALKALDRALSIEKNQTEALFLTGLVYEGKSDIVNAIKYFERVIKQDQTYIPPYFSLALIKLSQGKFNESLQLCQTCLSQSPNNLRVLLFLGDIQIKAGDYWAALAVFEQILGIISSMPEQETKTKQTKEINLKCNLQITHIYRHFHEYEKAIIHLENCLNLDKDHPAYLHELGTVIILNKGDLAYALDLFKQASNDCPENPYYIFSTAEVLHRMHKYELEIEMLTKCLAMKPQFEEKIYNNLALAYQSLHKTDKALEVFQQGLTNFPEGQQLHFNYGNFLYQLKRLNEAAVQYEKCLQKNSCHVSALNNLGKVQLFFKDFQRVADCFNQCMLIRPKKNEIYETRVNALLAKGYYPNQM